MESTDEITRLAEIADDAYQTWLSLGMMNISKDSASRIKLKIDYENALQARIAADKALEKAIFDARKQMLDAQAQRREDMIDAKRERETEYDFERDSGA